MTVVEQQTSIDIAAPPERVWEVLADVERWPEWTESVTSARQLDPGPLSVGSRVEVVQPRIPKGTYTVTVVEPGKSFTWEQRQPGSVVTAVHSSTPLPDGGTRVELKVVMTGALGIWASSMEKPDWREAARIIRRHAGDSPLASSAFLTRLCSSWRRRSGSARSTGSDSSSARTSTGLCACS